MKAPVGPPIWTDEPPKNDTMKPPIMAVIRPVSGDTPLAIPKAMAKGKATIPTITPAMRSAMKRSRLYPWKTSSSFGLKYDPIMRKNEIIRAAKALHAAKVGIYLR